MKKLVRFLLMIVVIVVSSGTLSMASGRDIQMLINGSYVEMSVKPEVINGRTMIPVRGVLEELGATVDWKSDTKEVFVKKEGTEVILKIGEVNLKIMYSGESEYKQKTIDQAPVIKEGRTLVPIRFIAEELGYKVGWDAYDRTVTVTDPNYFISRVKTGLKNYFDMVSDLLVPKTWVFNSSFDFNYKSEDTSVGGKTDVEVRYNQTSLYAKLNLNMNMDLSEDNWFYDDLHKMNKKDIWVEVYLTEAYVMIKTNLARFTDLGIERYKGMDLEKNGVIYYIPKEELEQYKDILKEAGGSLAGGEDELQNLIDKLSDEELLDFNDAYDLEEKIGMFKIFLAFFNDQTFTKQNNVYQYNLNKTKLVEILKEIVKQDFSSVYMDEDDIKTIQNELKEFTVHLQFEKNERFVNKYTMSYGMEMQDTWYGNRAFNLNGKIEFTNLNKTVQIPVHEPKKAYDIQTEYNKQ